MASNLHFLILLPLMSPGHLIPMADMAKLIAPKGPVWFSTVITDPTPKTPIPSCESGLPEECESTDDLPSFSCRVLQSSHQHAFDIVGCCFGSVVTAVKGAAAARHG
ncbi:hypothetical protein OSB04_009957 [Centaurea solstitialis]|uniref:Uncharacterized protein n=1 Tax=Centaurea solstitialis TaxID=347529 RepID=A0AA38T6L3_9ASTR|nr:hypothetical protein OSB04_009957 [Centaurea solstitialis]